MAALGRTRFAAASSTVLLPALREAPVAGRLLGSSPKGLYLCFEPALGAVVGPCVIAVLPTSSVRLPLAMVTNEELPLVQPDEPITVGDGVLRVGPYVWHPNRWFEPRPRQPHAPKAPALAEAAQLLWNLGDDEIGLPLVRAWSAATALAAGDPDPCRALLGAGPGLTPAGDDVVAGALAACVLSGARPLAAEADMLIARACLATTALSAALLACAARGQVVPQAAELLRALGEGAAIAPALTHLRGVGSTSGTALAVGMVAALSVAGRERDPLLNSPRALVGAFSVTERP